MLRGGLEHHMSITFFVVTEMCFSMSYTGWMIEAMIWIYLEDSAPQD